MFDTAWTSLSAGASAADVLAARPLAVSALQNTDLAKRLVSALLDVATSEPEASAAAGAAAVLTFQLTLSQNGTAVARYDSVPPSDAPPVGVLILGFGGASLDALRPLAEFYGRIWPSWRVLATTRAGMSDEDAADALAAQRRAVVDGLAGCGRLLVHVL